MLSLPHLIVLFVVALIIFGPEKLPELARMLGKATGEFRRMTNDFRNTLDDEVRELERQTRIRNEEIATAAQAAQSAQTPPEGTVGRSLPHADASVVGEPQPSPHADPDPAQPAQPVAVATPHEKPPMTIQQYDPSTS